MAFPRLGLVVTHLTTEAVSFRTVVNIVTYGEDTSLLNV
jgi:hypothetical protein